MNPRWLLRMAKWARNPPSEKRVIFGIAILVICLVIVVVERYVGWPEMLSLDPKSFRTTR